MPMNEKSAVTPTVRVKGGAGPSEAAAIAAVIQKVIDDERAAGAQPTGRRALDRLGSCWSRRGRCAPPGQHCADRSSGPS